MKFLTIIFLVFKCFTLSLNSANQNPGSLQIGTRAPQFSLKDQYDVDFILENNQDQALILLIGDHQAREELSSWAKEMTNKYPQKIKVIFIISFPDMPFFLKAWVKGEFKNNNSDNKEKNDSVFIDWGGTVFKLYESVKKNANVILIDSNGFTRGIERGKISPENKTRLFQAIERLLLNQK
jgi:hypothetical protein